MTETASSSPNVREEFCAEVTQVCFSSADVSGVDYGE
jgi:hypothetical protein